ncbi:hypothetical protein CEXT_495111 [Caerostris extrusa]|uniref:Uncharacterized protein n=1 Tax=Caerostris extrusa TaxID=172846 RepID=A0AAV4S334_CAEEX|nr:hypothetical protein CEXT_495111 [Caerostris extrusa]
MHEAVFTDFKPFHSREHYGAENPNLTAKVARYLYFCKMVFSFRFVSATTFLPEKLQSESSFPQEKAIKVEFPFLDVQKYDFSERIVSVGILYKMPRVIKLT